MELTTKQFVKDFKERYFNKYSNEYTTGTDEQLYYALGTLIRSYASKGWKNMRDNYIDNRRKQVYYFSIEFLPGKFLLKNAYNLGILETVKEGLKELDLDLDRIVEIEPEPAIGNGGLGRLASCYLDSGAALGLPVHGNGIRYKYGLFKQKFVDGHQVELPDNWLKDPYPWEIRNNVSAVTVRMGGNVWMREDGIGGLEPVYEDTLDILAVPYDNALIGYNEATTNNLRLWSAEVTPEDEGKLDKHSRLQIKEINENLYPDDTTYEGKRLRLKQEYFFVSAGVQSVIRQFKKYDLPRKQIPDKIAIQINDTHPALVIPELMRILLDEEKLSWERAWEITVNTVAYTNHTILSEAMETWEIGMFKELLPRMYQIIEEINRRHVQEQLPLYGRSLTYATQIIKDGQIHMAHLAIIGSHSTNGVASLHTEILKDDSLKQFYEMFPHRFNNKTNGITQRRFLHLCNPGLTELITKKIGNEWKTNPSELKIFKGQETNKQTLKELEKVKLANKKRLAKYVKEQQGLEINTDAIFDVMIKRLHAYKRQQLQLLHIIDRYLRIKVDGETDIQPRVFIFGAKAAPGYRFAKQVIKVINELANLINHDDDVNDKLQIVFIENYNVSKAEYIIPAAEISEQISLAGKEASGTGNMKMMLNGAITVGTMDGANVEIHDYVGEDNIYIFGMDREEVRDMNWSGGYNPREFYETNPRLQRAINALVDGTIPNVTHEGRDIYDAFLVHGDEYYCLKDFDSFVHVQEDVDKLYQNKTEWNRKSLLNIASAGPFSSDFAVARYATDIWNARPVHKAKKDQVVSFDQPI